MLLVHIDQPYNVGRVAKDGKYQESSLHLGDFSVCFGILRNGIQKLN